MKKKGAVNSSNHSLISFEETYDSSKERLISRLIYGIVLFAFFYFGMGTILFVFFR